MGLQTLLLLFSILIGILGFSMAQDSAFHDGTTVGDAASTSIWSAPYSSSEYSDILSKIMAGDSSRGFVIPYGDDLSIVPNSPTALNVIAKSGAAFLRGRIYENTADAILTIAAADATNPRIDSIILRYTAANNEIRLVVLEGTPSATPTKPTLTTTAAIYEVELAYVWVAALAATIEGTEIHDSRLFEANFDSLFASLHQDNLIHNSEFMAFSGLDNAGNLAAPDRWTLVLTPSAIAGATKPAQMSRGRGVQITANAASEGFSQQFQVKASTHYVIRLLTNVTAGDVGEIIVTSDSASPLPIQRYVRRTGSWIEETIHYDTEADATKLTVSLLCLNNGDIVSYGQVLAVEGYIPGPFRQIHEMIWFDTYVTDANWEADAKSSADTVIDLSTDYQGLILDGTRGIWVRAQISDSASSGTANANFGIRMPVGGTEVGPRVHVGNLSNGASREGLMFGQIVNRAVTYVVVASSGSNLTATIRIIGIEI